LFPDRYRVCRFSRLPGAGMAGLSKVAHCDLPS
jgi:hypothetical protein